MNELGTGPHREGGEEKHSQVGNHHHERARGERRWARVRHELSHVLSHLNPFGHSHDSADSVDDALASNEEGIRALKISLGVLMATGLPRGAGAAFSGPVAPLAARPPTSGAP